MALVSFLGGLGLLPRIGISVDQAKSLRDRSVLVDAGEIAVPRDILMEQLGDGLATSLGNAQEDEPFVCLCQRT